MSHPSISITYTCQYLVGCLLMCACLSSLHLGPLEDHAAKSHGKICLSINVQKRIMITQWDVIIWS